MHAHNHSYALLKAIYIATLAKVTLAACLSQIPIATCVTAPLTSGGSVELNRNHVKPHFTCVTKDPSFIYFIYYLAISLLTHSTSC